MDHGLKGLKEKDICVVRWFDNSAVTLAPTFAGVKLIDHVRRWCAVKKEFVMVWHPECVQVYNKFMSGVDKLGSLVSYYRIRRRTKNGLLELFIIL